MNNLYDEIMGTEDHTIGPKKRRSKRKDLEGSVQRECLAWLVAHQDVLYIERRNSGAIQFSDGARIRFGAKGAADIWCLVNATKFILDAIEADAGRSVPPIHVEIECKRRDGRGRLSADQKAFQKHCEEIGVPYLVVTSAEDLEQQLKERALI